MGRASKQAFTGWRTSPSANQEFGWTCWEHNGLYYARRPDAPGHDYDAHGDDPADLREAILVALRYGGRDDQPGGQPRPPPERSTDDMARDQQPGRGRRAGLVTGMAGQGWCCRR